jgi:hypothetical protein
VFERFGIAEFEFAVRLFPRFLPPILCQFREQSFFTRRFWEQRPWQSLFIMSAEGISVATVERPRRRELTRWRGKAFASRTTILRPNARPRRSANLSELFADAGYATALYGKWHVGEADGRLPIDQAF